MITLLIQLIDLLNKKIPAWVVLLIAIAGIWFLSYQEKEVTTEVVYANIWSPPAPKLGIKPSIITLYKPYPAEQLKPDTIFVPVYFDRYLTFEPNKVESNRAGIIINAFDPSTLSYNRLSYFLPAPRFSYSLYTDTSFDYFGSHRISLGYEMRYRKLTAYSEIGLNGNIDKQYFHAVAGIRYNIFERIIR